MLACLYAGAAVLPPTVPALQALSPPLRKPHVAFAIGGERGNISIWRTDTGKRTFPAHQLPSDAAAGATAGEEITHLELDEASGELLTCSGDCRLSYYDLQVWSCRPASVLVMSSQLNQWQGFGHHQ